MKYAQYFNKNKYNNKKPSEVLEGFKKFYGY